MSLNLYKGRRFLNLRWWKGAGSTAIPTREGVTIPLEAVEDFERAVAAVAAALRASEPWICPKA